MAVSDPKISVLISGRTAANGDTAYTDELGSAFVASGAASMSSSSPAYGPTAMRISGTGTSDHWSTTAVAPWVLGSGDFCVEVWINQTSSEAIYLDNSGQNGNAGWRIGLYAPVGDTRSLYWYSDVGGFQEFALPTAPAGSGERYFRFERIGSTVSVYDGTTRRGQYTDSTNYSAQAARAYVGRANNDLSFRPFAGKIYARITKGGNRGGGGASTLPAIPSPYGTVTRTLTVDPVAYTVTRAPVSLLASRIVTVNPAAYAVTPAPVALLSGRVLSVDPAAYAVVPAPVSVLADRVLTVDPSAYAIEAAPVALLWGRVLNVDAAAYVVDARPVALVADRVLSVDPVAYVIEFAPVQAGADDRTIDVEPAAYAIDAAPVTLLRDRVLNVEPAAYAIEFSPVDMQLDGRVLAVEPALYAVDMAPVALLRDRVLNVQPAVYAIAAFDVWLVRGSAEIATASTWIEWNEPGEARSFNDVGESREAKIAGELREWSMRYAD